MATSVLLTTTTATSAIYQHLDRPIAPATITVKGEDRLLDYQYCHDSKSEALTDINEIDLDAADNNDKDISFSFLSLPAEVRNQIYKYLFADVKLKLGLSTTHVCTSLRQNLSQNQRSAYTSVWTGLRSSTSQQRTCGSFCTCSFPFSIMHTCRLLRSETTSLLLSDATLEVGSRIEKIALLPDYFLSLVKRVIVLDAKQLSLCSTVGINKSGAGCNGNNISGISGAVRGSGTLDLSKFQSLKMLEVRNISVWCQYYEDSYLETPEADECMFNLAMFNLRRIGNGNLIVKLCEDEKRGFEILLGCQFVGNSRRGDTLVSIEHPHSFF